MPKVKVKSLGCLRRPNGQMLVHRAFDNVKQEYYYRFPGGTVEFGERSEETLHREFMEELGIELIDVCHLGVLENVFVHKGEPGHEIVFIYQARAKNTTVYESDILDGLDKDEKFYWTDESELMSGRFYPEGVKKLLTKCSSAQVLGCRDATSCVFAVNS